MNKMFFNCEKPPVALSKVLLILSFQVLTLSAFSQIWFNEGAKWWYSHSNYSPGTSYPAVITYEEQEVINDTVFHKIGGQYYFKDGDKIYARGSDSLRLLYDFSLAPGESYLYCSFMVDQYIRLDSVSTIEINGKTRKVQHFGDPQDQGVRYTAIEGIGFLDFFDPYTNCSDAFPMTSGLRCFQDDSLGLYSFVDYDCDSIIHSPYKPSKSYEWAPVGAVWYYSQLEYAPPWHHNYVKIESIRDTVIQGHRSRILDRNGNEIIMRSDSGRVYLFDNDSLQFNQLYDFSANAGESWQAWCWNKEYMTVYVDSVDTVTINGKQLRKQYISHEPGSWFYFSGPVIENIGSIGYMFPQYGAADPPVGGPLRCYEDSVLGYFNTGIEEHCDTTYTAFPSITGWAPVGAQWWYSIVSPTVSGYIKIERTGDTLIKNRNCQVLSKSMYGYDLSFSKPKYFSNPMGKVYTYYEKGKVYYHARDTFGLLYDFNASEDDTLNIMGYFANCGETGTVYVDSVQTTTFNGRQLKTIWTSPYNQSFHEIGKIMSRIGSFNYILPQVTEYCGIADLAEGGPLRCYKDPEIGTFSTGIVPSCDYMYTSLPEQNINSIKIYPNPATKMLNIKLPGTLTGHSLTISLFDAFGKKVLNRSFTGAGENVSIPLKKIPPAIYHTVISLNHEPIYTSRLFVQ